MAVWINILGFREYSTLSLNLVYYLHSTIANFFKQLGWVEELGSGVRKMFKYCPIYVKDSLPIIEEGDIFKLNIRYESAQDTTGGTTQEITLKTKLLNKSIDSQLFAKKTSNKGTTQETARKTTQETTARILRLIEKNPQINRIQMANELGDISEDGVKYYLAKMIKVKIIKHLGSTKRGYWVVLKLE